jgi:hypothetical protein
VETVMAGQRQSGGWIGLGVLLLVGGLVVTFFMPSPLLAWLASFLSLAALAACLGKFFCDRIVGILINDQNLMSLSRLQTVMWTLIVLSAYAAIALSRAHLGVDPGKGIGIDKSLWTLMGINTAALVGTPFLLSIRRDKTVDEQKLSTVASDTPAVAPAASGATVPRSPLDNNESPAAARFTDVFVGDEIRNSQSVDLAKAQMFFFTVVSAIVWIAATCQLMARLTGVASLAAEINLPVIPDGMVTLLGFSNAGYVGSKGIAHTPTTT